VYTKEYKFRGRAESKGKVRLRERGERREQQG